VWNIEQALLYGEASVAKDRLPVNCTPVTPALLLRWSSSQPLATVLLAVISMALYTLSRRAQRRPGLKKNWAAKKVATFVQGAQNFNFAC